MMQRRVQNLDLFSCQIDKGDNELGLCTCIFFDPADEDGKEPGVFITEIIEGGAVHKLGCIRVFDQIIKIGDINLIGLDEAEIVSTFKKMDDSPFQIEIGREPPEVKSELIELLELSEERKKYFMDSLIVQEKIGDITIVRGQASICRSPRVPWFWMASDLKFVIGVLKILIEEDQGCRKDIQAIFEQANIFQDNYKDMNTYNVNMEQKPDESDKEGTFLPLAPEEEFLLGQFKIKPKEIKNEDLSPEQLLAQGDFNSETPIKKEKEEDEIVVEEEIISTGKPTEGKAKKGFSWFRNIKERKLWNFFHFKKHDKQVKNVHKWEEIDQEVLDDYCPYSTEAPKTLPTQWTNIEVGNWLWSIGMEEYVVKFYCKGINGGKLLILDNRSLKEIEVNRKKDRRKILKAIKKIRDFLEKNHIWVLL